MNEDFVKKKKRKSVNSFCTQFLVCSTLFSWKWHSPKEQEKTPLGQILWRAFLKRSPPPWKSAGGGMVLLIILCFKPVLCQDWWFVTEEIKSRLEWRSWCGIWYKWYCDGRLHLHHLLSSSWSQIQEVGPSHFLGLHGPHHCPNYCNQCCCHCCLNSCLHYYLQTHPTNWIFCCCCGRPGLWVHPAVAPLAQ